MNTFFNYIVQFCRIVVGALFLFSGLIKANDPMGTSYKLQEYFTVFHVGFLNGSTDYLSILFCGLEVALGFAILLGSFSRISTLFLTGLILFFTWLTGYSAITGKVTDCGCFGDFIHLEPLHSFYKDLFLLALTIILLLGRDKITPIFGLKWNSFLLVLATVLSFFVPIWAFNHLPFIDLLAYKPGNNIKEQMQLPAGAKKDSIVTVLVCKNKTTGLVEELDSKVYVKQFKEYEYLNRKDKVIRKGDVPAIHDFILYDNYQRQVQDSLLAYNNYSLWVVVYDLTTANKKAFEKINELAKAMSQNLVPVLGITHSTYTLTDPFRHEVQAAYPFYYAGDDKFVKTMMRSNPGLILMKNGTIIKKWHYNNVPSYTDAMHK